MAQKTYTLNLDVNSASLGDLENELEQINAELKQVDRNSDAFKQLSSNAQEVTKEIKKTNDAIEGMTLEKKLNAADGAIKVMAGSLQTAVGTLGLLGVESEVFGEFEKRAASAISVGMGLKDMSEGFGKVFPKTMAKSVTAVQTFAKGTSKALIATGVGAFVVLLGAIIANWDAIVKGVKKVIDSSEGLTNFFNSVKRGFNSIFESIRPVLEFFGLYPTLEEQAAQAAKENSEQRIKDIDNELKVRKAAGEDTVALEREKLTKLRDLQEKGTQEYKNAQADLDAFEAKLKKDKADKDAADAAAAEAKRKEEAAKEAEKLKAEEEKKKNDAIQYEKDKAAAIKEVRDAVAISEDEKRVLEQTKLQEEYAAKIELAKKFGIDTTELEAASREAQRLLQEQYDAEDAAKDAERTANAKAEADKRVADAIAAKEAQVQIEQAKWALLSQAAGLAKELAGENEAVAIGAVIATQAAAIGQIVSSTGLANAKALAASPLTFGQPWVGINTVSAGLSIASAIASGAKSIKEIKASKNSTSVGGGAPTLPNRRGGGAPPAPMGPTNTNGVNIQNVDEIRQETTTPAVKAYVVSGDVRSNAEAEAKIATRRTLD